jgi:hypothetical protein
VERRQASGPVNYSDWAVWGSRMVKVGMVLLVIKR